MYSAPHRFGHDPLAELGELQPVDVAQIGEVGVHLGVQLEADVLAFEAHWGTACDADEPPPSDPQRSWCSACSLMAASPRGDELRPLAMSPTEDVARPISSPIAWNVIPAACRSRIRCAHVLIDAKLRDYVIDCQRHSVTEARHDAVVASPDTRTPGERARARREALKIDRRVFAGLVGMPYSTLADWENGRIVNTAKVPIHVIAEQLQTSAEWLLSGRGSADAREVRDAPPVALADRQTFWGFDLTRDAAELGWEWQKLSAEERDALAEVIRTLVKRRKEAEVKPGKRKRAPAESRAQA